MPRLGYPAPAPSLSTPASVAGLVLVMAAVGCAGDRPEPLVATAPGAGPMVRYDILTRPFPDVPFPNDAATRLDETSPTGRRINVTEEAATEVERRVRRRINQLPGFGVAAPITVAFDAPIDAWDLRERQHGDDDISNDAMLLIRLGPEMGDGEACEARRVGLDVGGGYFPLILEKPCQYGFQTLEGDYNCLPYPCDLDDPRTGSSNLLFETIDEDLDGDGVLDPYEDTDFDGHLDRPNTWSGTDSGDAAADDLITFYEKETNTVLAWPTHPLVPATRYAVVLTRHMKGIDGESVRSPFEGVAHAQQRAPLAQLEELLPCHGLALEDVAFAWVFTTGTPTRELLAVREGLYGSGPLAELADLAPVENLFPGLARDVQEDGTLPERPYVLPIENLLDIMTTLTAELLETPGAGADLVAEAPLVDYFVLGEFDSPNLLIDKDGRATAAYPDDSDEIWDVDLDADPPRVTAGTWRVPFICAIPKATEEHKPPFPAVLYGHGYSGASFEILGFSGRFARSGLALCAIEAPGHGLVVPAEEKYILDALEYFVDALGLRTFFDDYYGGRVRDLDNDGFLGERDNGTDFWVADVFHTRDMVRQLALDQMQMIRILRSADGTRRMPVDVDLDGTDDLLADFNGDGVPDLGGWHDGDGDGVWDDDESPNLFYAWGQSMGGISTALLAAIEPSLRAAVPVSAAGTLVNVATRSTNLGVPEAVMLPVLGPFVTFTPHLDPETGVDDGRVDVGWLLPKLNEAVRPVFHTSAAILPGDRIVVRNLDTGESKRAWAPATRRFRVGIAADALRTGEKRELLGMNDDTVGGVVAPVDLLGAKEMGHRIRIEVLDGWDGPVKEVIDQVAVPFDYLGITYPAEMPLIAPHEGLGYTRNSPNFRRILALSQTALEPGDPVAYARHIRGTPLQFDYETADVRERRDAGTLTSFVQYHTVGDADVPMAAGLSLSRAAGIIDTDQMAVMVDTHVVEGIERVMRWPQRKEAMNLCPPTPTSEWRCPPARVGQEPRYRAFFERSECAGDQGTCAEGCPEGEVCFYDDVCVPCDPACAAMADAPLEGVHFDVMDLDGGSDRLTLPEYQLAQPIRPTWTEGGSVFGLRVPYLSRYGSHGVPPSIPEKAFNINGFVVNQVAWLFETEGAELVDDACMEGGTCAFLPWGLGE